MLDKWSKTIKLKLSWDEFHQLPQNPAYKYEYFDETAWLTPRLKCYHAVLNLAEFCAPEPDLLNEDVRIRRLDDADWKALPDVFASAFARVSPFSSMDQHEQLGAASDSLGFTQRGGNGPLIREACLVAADPNDESIIGSFLVTLVPDVRLSEIDFGHVPKEGVAAGEKLVPHLTWVFVELWQARHGVAAAMLSKAVSVLRRLGHNRLTTTFLLGNESSTLWHWRMGFRLASYPMSNRQLEQRAAKASKKSQLTPRKGPRKPAKR